MIREILPKEYLIRFLENKIREDGREFHESRALNIKTNVIEGCSGSATATLGQTQVMCIINSELYNTKEEIKIKSKNEVYDVNKYISI